MIKACLAICQMRFFLANNFIYQKLFVLLKKIQREDDKCFKWQTYKQIYISIITDV